MATTRTHRTTIEIYGLEVPVEVEYTIHNWGSWGNDFDDPSDPVDFEVESVTSTLTGRDLTELCETYYTGTVYLIPEWAPTLPEQQPADPVQTAIFGSYRSTGVAPLSLEHREDTRRLFYWYGTRFREAGHTLLDHIYADIADDVNALEPTQYD